MTREEAYGRSEEDNTIESGVCDACGHEGRVVQMHAPDAMGIPTWVLSLCSKCGGTHFVAAQSRDDAHHMRRATKKLARMRREANRKANALVANPDAFVSDDEVWEDLWNEYGDAVVA
jgi:hypothetical protein